MIMETKQLATIPPVGSIVVFTPRGTDVELHGSVLSSSVSTLDQQTYLKIKAEDGKTYTKQLKYVELAEPAESLDNQLPESLLKEIKAITQAPRQKEMETFVRKFLKKELTKMIKVLK